MSLPTLDSIVASVDLFYKRMYLRIISDKLSFETHTILLNTILGMNTVWMVQSSFNSLHAFKAQSCKVHDFLQCENGFIT